MKEYIFITLAFLLGASVVGLSHERNDFKDFTVQCEYAGVYSYKSDCNTVTCDESGCSTTLLGCGGGNLFKGTW